MAPFGPPLYAFTDISQVGSFATLSDIMFLAKKEYDNKLVESQGGLPGGVTGDLAILTASAGKDLYIGIARVNVSLDSPGDGSGTGRIELKVNGITIAGWNFTLIVTPGEGGNTMDSYEFPIGFKVTASQTIKIECTVAGTDVLTEGQLVGWQESSGIDPSI